MNGCVNGNKKKEREREREAKGTQKLQLSSDRNEKNKKNCVWAKANDMFAI